MMTHHEAHDPHPNPTVGVLTLVTVELADANAPVGPQRAYADDLAVVSTLQPVSGSFAIDCLSASAKASAEAPPSQVTTAMACASPAAWSPPAARTAAAGHR